jgi:hypothetical protein
MRFRENKPVHCENCIERKGKIHNQYTEYSFLKQVFCIFVINFKDKFDSPHNVFVFCITITIIII